MGRVLLQVTDKKKVKSWKNSQKKRKNNYTKKKKKERDEGGVT